MTWQGDSGGTLNLRQEAENKWTQIGVTSFVSSAGCESGNPHGFTRVAYFGQVTPTYKERFSLIFLLQWIESETGLKLGY